MKHILKYQLLILILCLATASSQSKALVISSDKTLVAKNDSLVNLSSAQGIEKIWLEDCRPDSNVVILSWIGSELPDTINCRIQRWEKIEGPINFKILNVKVAKNQDQYEFRDREIKSDIDYRYKIWILLKDGYSISPEVSTVKPISIAKWGDCSKKQPDLSVLVYVNGLNDTVVANRNNGNAWFAKSLQFQIKVKEDCTSSAWQDSDCIEFSPKNVFENLADNDRCCYRIRGKDEEGNICRWSDWEFAILDTSPPSETEHFDVIAELNADSTDGWMKLRWSKAKDNLSGVSHYQLLRKSSPDSQFKEIENARNLTSTFYDDPFRDVRINTKIYYQLKCFDNVGNERVADLNSGRCLIGPIISSNVDSTSSDSVQVYLNHFDITDVDSYEIQINSFNYRVLKDDFTFNIFLPDDGINNIRIRAVYQDIHGLDSLFSAWSNVISVMRGFYLKVTSVSVDHDTNFSTMHEGNLTVTWTLNQSSGGELHIYREAIGTDLPILVARVKSSNGYWYDYFDSTKWDLKVDQLRPCLKPFLAYIYSVFPINPFNGSQMPGSCDTNYCNIAPEITRLKFIPDIDGTVFENKLMTKWKIPDNSMYNLSVAKFDLVLFTNFCPQTINEIENGTNRASVANDSIHFWRGISKGSNQYFFVRSKVIIDSEHTIASAWSKLASCKTRDITPITNNELIAQDQPGKGLYLDWQRYNDEFVDCYRIIIDDDELSTITTSDKYYMHCPEKLDTVTLFKYKIQPGVIDFSNREKPEIIYFDKIANNEIIATNDPGRVYVPCLDMQAYPMGSYCGGNSLSVRWFWESSTGKPLEKSCDFRGAHSLEIKLFNENRDFISSSRIILNPSNFEESNFNFEFLNWAKQLNCPNCCCVYLQLSAFDRWEHSYCSSEFDGDIGLIRDCQPPDAINELRFESWASETYQKFLVDVYLHWERPQDLSRIDGYAIFIDSLTSGSYQEIDSVNFRVGLSDGNKKGYKLRDNILIQSQTCALKDTIIFKNISVNPGVTQLKDRLYRYRIESYDPFCNKQPSSNNAIAYFKYVIAPDSILSIDRDPTNTIVTWSKVASADSYYIEFVDNKEMLGDLDIRFVQNYYVTDNTQIIIPNSDFLINGVLYTHYIHIMALDSVRGLQSSWAKFDSVTFDYFDQEKNISSSISDNESLPTEFKLRQSYPNPFNSQMTISFELPRRQNSVMIRIFNTLSNEVRSFKLNNCQPGFHSIFWDGKDNFGNETATGIYLYSINTEDFHDVKKCLKLK